MNDQSHTGQDGNSGRFVLRSEPKIASFAEGISWFVDGFKLFMRSPFSWMFAFFLWSILNLVLGITLFSASKILWPIFLAGFMVGAYQLDKYNIFPYESVFSGFSNRARDLIMLGLYYFVAFIVIKYVSLWITEAFVGDLSIVTDEEKLVSLYTAQLTGQITQEQLQELLSFMQPLFFFSMIFLSLLLPVYMALWFAPALVVINGVSPLNAFKLSFLACLRNMWSFLGYGVVSFAAMLIGSIPMGLGLVIVMPVMFASIYTSYKDIFIDESGFAGPDSGKDNNKIGIEV